MALCQPVALRTVLNFEVKVTHRLAFNPVYAVQLETEEREEAQHWTRAQADRFLAATADDPMGLMFRVAVLRGPRRGELVGFRWSASDLDAGYLGVGKTILQLGGTVTFEDKAKTTASRRKVWLDDTTVSLLRAHRKAQVAMRLRAVSAWEDNDLVFCREDGSPWPPDSVSRRWKAAARAAEVPVIRFHDGRHTSVTAKDEAGIDKEVSRDQTGHAGQAIHEHYTHRAAAKYRDAANQLAAHIESAAL